MRPRRLILLPLTVATALVTAAPAMAAELPIDIVDFAFHPPTVQVQPGDTVVWSFDPINQNDHSTTAVAAQAEKWNSGVQPAGAPSFSHTFTRPGRYQYICIPHESFMKGTIVVGQDAVADTVDAFKTKRRGTSVRISFKLNEPAKMTYKLKGRTKKKIERTRLTAGRHSFKLRRLKPGRYRGTLTLVDDFDHRVTAKKSFVVP